MWKNNKLLGVLNKSECLLKYKKKFYEMLKILILFEKIMNSILYLKEIDISQ